MSNLLDKASVILTPTAYNNGEALCVKPSDGSGDFDFSRNSAATRVNAQGLVENVQILSSNLVQNGDFSEEGVQEVSNGSFSQEGAEEVTNGSFDTDSDWVKGTGWSISGGKANFNGTSNNNLQQNNVTEQNKIYKVSFEVSDYVSGTVQVIIGDNLAGEDFTFSSNGVFVFYTTADSGTTQIVRFRPTTSAEFSIDNVSVREVGQDWNVGSDWSIAENKAVSSGSGNNLQQTINISSNKTYKLTFDVISTSGTLAFDLGGSTAKTLTDSGSKEYYFQRVNNNNLRFYGGNYYGEITNISVKEVLQDWSVADYGAVSPSAVITPNTEGVKLEKTVSADWRSSFLVQPISYTNGSQYKVTFKLKNGNLPSGGSVFVRRAYDSSSQSIVNNLTLTNDWVEYTYYFVADSNSEDISFGEVNWQNAGVGQYFYIDDVTLIEITDDTNLPRINYEGFSYQDALGSEKIVNGSFDDGSTGWNVAGGNPIFENSSVNFVNFSTINSNNTVVEQGKTYKITYTISNKVGNSSFGFFLGGWNVAQYQDVGTHSEIISVSSSSVIYIRNGDSNSSVTIDNVSVKEYLGQEVVPNSGCGSWLWEPQSTNLVTYSEDFSQYSTGNSPIIEGGFLAPDGTNNAYKITNTGSSTVYISGANFTSAATRSVYARSVSGTGTATLMSYFGNTNNVFTLTEDWQRFEVNGTTAAAGEDNFYAADFRGSGTLTEYIIWGAQVEEQPYATSYIPTSGSTVTRNQDVCTNGGSLATINSTEGVLYAEIAALVTASGSDMNIQLNDGLINSNSINILYQNSNAVIFQKYANGVRTTNLTTSSILKTDFNKIAVRYDATQVSVFLNGVNILSTADTNAFSSGLNDLSFSRANNTKEFFGKTKALVVYKEALSDEELTDLTTI